MLITDPEDPRLDDYRDLTDRAARERTEAANGLMIVEGVLAFRALLSTDLSVRSALLTPARAQSLASNLEGASFPVWHADRSVLDAVSGFPVHRGVLASVERPTLPHWSSLLEHRALLMVEEVNDLENIGSLFRTASALGAGGVILSPRCADPHYRRCVRVSQGQTLRLPFAVASDWPEPLDEAGRRGFDVVGLSPSGTESLTAAVKRRPVAVVVGSEGQGLSPDALSRCGRTVAIPMANEVDSLNVAVAAAIALHQLIVR